MNYIDQIQVGTTTYDIRDTVTRTSLSTKANAADVYTTTEINNLLSAKADSSSLGNLATLNTISYTSDIIINKPTLGTMALEDDAASDNKEYVRKNGAWSEASGGGGGGGIGDAMITNAVESSMVATQAYSVGALIIVGSTLYRATAEIADEDALTVGTNVEEINIETLLNEKALQVNLSKDSDYKITRYRVTRSYNSGSSSTHWYYPVAKLPVYNASGNAATIKITGRIGGWTADSVCIIEALIYNRNGAGISFLQISGTNTSPSTPYSNVDLILAKNSDNTHTLYLDCRGYHCFDINIETYARASILDNEHLVEYLYNATYLTTAPSNIQVKASTSTRRVEIANSKLYVAGTEVISFPEAPSDNTYYVRKNGAWVALPVYNGGVS